MLLHKDKVTLIEEISPSLKDFRWEVKELLTSRSSLWWKFVTLDKISPNSSYSGAKTDRNDLKLMNPAATLSIGEGSCLNCVFKNLIWSRKSVTVLSAVYKNKLIIKLKADTFIALSTPCQNVGEFEGNSDGICEFLCSISAASSSDETGSPIPPPIFSTTLSIYYSKKLKN